MKQAQYSPVLLPLLFFIVGIGVELRICIGVFLFLILTYLVLCISHKVKFSKDLLDISSWSLIIGVLFFCLGKMNVVLNSESARDSSVSKVYFDSICIKIDDDVRFTEYGCWMIASVNNSFNVLLNIDSIHGAELEKGDILFLYQTTVLPLLKEAKELSGWEKYLLRQGVSRKIYVNSKSRVELRKSKNWIYYLYNRAHKKIISSSLSLKSKALVLSLLLGDRGYIDKETKNEYAVLGVSHILSVSGLHVGIIYMIITWVFKQFIKMRSAGAVCVVLFLIWFYCWMVGFSSPVIRSALMFSLHFIGNTIGRDGGLLHAASLSAFVILALNPLALYEISFQLTYGAMLGIIFIMPLLSNCWKTKSSALKYVFDLVFLSISVQITLLPFLIYYFEYVSLYFILSNLIIVPLVGFLMYLGILFLFVPEQFWGVEKCVAVIDRLVLFMDWFCEVVSNWPLTAISVVVSSLSCWVCYSLGLGLFIQYRNYRVNGFLYLGMTCMFVALLFI